MSIAIRLSSQRAILRTPNGATPSSTFQTQRAPALRLSVTMGRQPEIELALI
jgi:hypothetical protein